MSYYEQKRDLPEIKAEIRPEYQDIHSQVLQDVLLRLDTAFKNFFRRVKNGEKPGYPRFQGRNRYASFCSPQGGYSLTHESRLCLSKIGSIKTCTIKHAAGQWSAVFSCECEKPEPLPVVTDEVGLDLGVTHFAALSRKKRGSHRRKKAERAVAKAHRKIRNQRKDFHHKQAKRLVDTHQLIVFEDLAVANVSKRAQPKQDENGVYLPNGAAAKSGLNKSILDAGWTSFQQIVTSKAEWAGRTVLLVNPRYTSQVCSQCGVVRKKDLSERGHSCECGAELDRDTNAAINILRVGRTRCGETCLEAPAF